MRSLAALLLPLALGLAALPHEASARPPAAKVAAKKKVEPKKADAKKAEPKDAKKAEPKKADAKKAEKKSEPKGKKGAKAPKDPSLSVGAPNRGKLQGGMLLKGSKTLKQRAAAHSWGHPALVKLLHRGADKVAKKHKGSVMFLGDLSRKDGGRVDGHASHQSGRDADIGFYVTNSKGGAMFAGRFVSFDGQGKARDGTSFRFDDARNWALVEALLKDTEIEVRYLFVSPGLRARLVTYANAKKVPKELVTKAASVLVTPKDADPHDDHFHLRVRCPKDSTGVCFEESFGGDVAPTPKDADLDAKKDYAKGERKDEPKKDEPAKKDAEPKAEAPKPEPKKDAEPKAEAPKPEPKKDAEPKPEAPRPEPKKDAEPKPEPKKDAEPKPPPA